MENLKPVSLLRLLSAVWTLFSLCTAPTESLLSHMSPAPLLHLPSTPSVKDDKLFNCFSLYSDSDSIPLAAVVSLDKTPYPLCLLWMCMNLSVWMNNGFCKALWVLRKALYKSKPLLLLHGNPVDDGGHRQMLLFLPLDPQQGHHGPSPMSSCDGFCSQLSVGKLNS